MAETVRDASQRWGEMRTGRPKAWAFSLSRRSSLFLTWCAVLLTSSTSSCIFSRITLISSERVTVLERS